MPSEPLKPWEPFATVVSPELGGAAPSAPTRADRAFDIARQVVQTETDAPALFYCLDCQTRHPLGTEFCAPSAPTTDAPTEPLAAIRARHEQRIPVEDPYEEGKHHGQAIADRAALLAEVERLTRQAESWATVVRQSQDGWDEALRERDALAEEVERLTAKVAHYLQVSVELQAERDALAARLRGGATAPTPDPTDDLRDAVRDLLTGLAHPEHLIGCGTVYQTTIPAHVVDRLRRWLRRDTGASHE